MLLKSRAEAIKELETRIALGEALAAATHASVARADEAVARWRKNNLTLLRLIFDSVEPANQYPPARAYYGTTLSADLAYMREVVALARTLREVMAPTQAGPSDDHFNRKGDREAANRVMRSQAYRNLVDLFTDDELRGLCFELGVDYAHLPGETRQGKAMELVLYCTRFNCLGELWRRCAAHRPGAKWP